MNRTDLWNRIWKEDAIDPQRPPTLRKAGVYPLLGLLILVLGINWPILSMGLREVSPVWMTVLRLAGGTLVVWLFTAASGRLRLPPREDMPVVLSVAFFRLAFVYLMVFTALQFVPPGRSSVLVWTASLWAVPMAWRFLGERMTRLRWTGLVIGILGIVFLVEPWKLSWSDVSVISPMPCCWSRRSRTRERQYISEGIGGYRPRSRRCLGSSSLPWCQW